MARQAYPIRPIEAAELEAFFRTDSAAFGGHLEPDELERFRPMVELDRTLAAFDGDRIVGTAGAYTFRQTLPGGAELPVAGVTYVGVLPTHRRQGILTAMMRRQLGDIRARGEPIAILLASESVIYGRFGYGLGTTQMDFELAAKRVAFHQPCAHDGKVVLLEKEEATRILPDVFERFRRGRPGQIARRKQYWDLYFRDPEKQRDGASARFYVGYRNGRGEWDGYAAYRIKENWQFGIAQSELRLQGLVSVGDEAYRALWEFLLAIDLVETIKAENRPLDEPLRWMLTDARRLRVTEVNDFLWVRLLDIPVALEGRRYPTAGELTFHLTDPFCPENNGVYRLEGGPDGATCRRLDGAIGGPKTVDPDFSLQVVDLGAAYLGGARFSTLAHAGRVVEHVPGSLARADAMFACEPLPWCSTGF